jgi:hypothetical protein
MVRGGRHKVGPYASWRSNTSYRCTPGTLLFIVLHILFQKHKANHCLSWDETWPMLGWGDVVCTVRSFTCWAEKKCSNIEENTVNNRCDKSCICWSRNESLWKKVYLDSSVVLEQLPALTYRHVILRHVYVRHPHIGFSAPHKQIITTLVVPLTWARKSSSSFIP